MSGPRRRAARAALAAVAAAAACAACGTSVGSLDLPVPPPTRAVVGTTTTVPVDGAGVAEVGVSGATTTTAVALGPGAATVTGSVTGPAGAVRGATVSIQRLVGPDMVTTQVLSGPNGGFVLPRVLGGRYRLRAWKAPQLDQTTSVVVFAPDRGTTTVALTLGRIASPTATVAYDPDPAVLDQPTALAVEVSDVTVGPAGTLTYTPQPSARVSLSGAWSVSGSAAGVTDAAGVASFVASCTAVGTDPLVALVRASVTVGLPVPPCVAPPPPPTTSTSSTTTPPIGLSGGATGAPG